ncbi:MAG: acireductone dioxygenase [Oscillatoria sp. PMC 1051.18]|uniref:1,2-dihydroxy-3-keto-5-methylthiopentene dioxygenase n=1 Tax=Oscillatoria salina TaxID=331517 RepID=UPI0013B824D3|nr:acireductone dioxygenase [Oscillatoria salina]MBZ8179610.1 acireductone dioxygenase [Oscillatoria salina IIICB1]MEC4892454.1 acireductone dioxygenase [Oscillatoria sp. PMC 1050.18]MEC5028504.1 acireductone dioxygenase [Oscillatoria sp. PMC 1051.18]NET90130.1 acireductone dioxygenase [Kamptonema sp. SIO1D9]
MAKLQLENNTIYTNLEDIARELAPLNVELNYWQIDDPETRNLLAQETLTDTQKEQVLQSLDNYFQHLKETAGYQDRDLIVLHPNTPNLDTLLSKFDRCHTHADAEVRYIIDGEGIFGFVRPDGTQVELTIHPEEYINVPARVEHWFRLTDSRRVKAVRYFTTTEGWIPEYTDTEIRLSVTSG